MSFLSKTSVTEDETNGGPAPVFDIPKECKAGVVVNEGPNFHVEVQTVPVPDPEPDEVLIKLNVTGICYSDLHFMLGDLGAPPMSTFGVRSPGHEGAGVVVKIGANVKNWKVGDRAGMKPRWYVCGDCELCLDNKETYCKKAKLCGLHKTGTYQQYVTSPASYTQRIPEGVDDYTAAPVMCSASTTVRSLIESGLKPGNWAVFPGGGGGVGIQGVQVAAAMGMRPIVVDTGAEKRDLVMKRGAEAFVDFKEVEDAAKEVVRIADGVGAHGVFVTAPAAYKNAVSYVGGRVGASVMCIGLPVPGTVLLGADPLKFAMQNLTIKGTLVGTRNDTAKALDFARRGKLQQIYTVYPIDKLPEAVEKIRKGDTAGRSVVDFNL